MRAAAILAAVALVAAPAHPQHAAPSASATAPRRSDAPDPRLDALIAACSAVEREQTVHALLRERNFVTWAVRRRLGLGASRVEWDECVLDVTARALRSSASLARDEIVAQLFEASEPLPFAAAMNVLGELGDERDLAMLVDWAATFAAFLEGEESASTAAEALRESCARLAALSARDARAWRREIERASETFRVALVRALADCGSDDALVRLSEQLGQGHVNDAIVLAELARAARRADRLHDEQVRRSVRALLGAESELRREAALCAGALGDEEAARELVALLSDASSGVRSNAQWALEHLTGRRLGAAEANWSRWITAETDWWRDEAPGLLRELGGADARGRVAAASTLVAHRFPRHSLAAELAAALPLNDRGAAPIVLAGLRQLRSLNAQAPLERARAQTQDAAIRADIDATLAVLRGLPARRGGASESQ